MGEVPRTQMKPVSQTVQKQVARMVYDTVDEEVVTMVPETVMERVQQQVQRMVPQTTTEMVATQVPRTVMQEVQTVQQPVQQVVQQPVQVVQQPVQHQPHMRHQPPPTQRQQLMQHLQCHTAPRPWWEAMEAMEASIKLQSESECP